MSDENRKLAAITFIDIVGYTAMMGQNVDLTLEKVDSVRSIIQDSVGEYHGELLKEMGDGFLLRFASTSNAIKSAISIQQQAKKLTIKIRIGIHVGEIIQRNNDIYGDGVNIASRIESIARPGTVYISGRVYEDIQNIPTFNARFRGEKKLKNVSRPIKVYEIVDKPYAESIVNKLFIRYKKSILTSIFTLIISVLLVWAYQILSLKENITMVKVNDEFGNELKREIPVPGSLKKLVIFLFNNDGKEAEWLKQGIPIMLKVDLEQDMFMQVRDGLLYRSDYQKLDYEDIADIPKNDLRRIAELWKLDFFITGRFNRINQEQLEIQIEVYNTNSGNVLGEHIVTGDEIYSMIDQLTRLIKSDLGFTNKHIRNAEDIPVEELLSSSLLATEYYSTGMEKLFIEQDYRSGIELLKNSIEEDSAFIRSYFQLSKTYWSLNRATQAKAYMNYVVKNINFLPERDQFQAKSHFYLMEEDNEKRIKVLKMYRDLYPQDLEAYIQLGELLYMTGNYEEAEFVFLEGLKIDDYRGEFLRYLGHINKYKGDFKQALVYYSQYKDLYPDVARSYRLLGDFQLNIGDFDDAEVSFEKAIILDDSDIISRINLLKVKERKGQFELVEDGLNGIMSHCKSEYDTVMVLLAIQEYYILRGEIQRSIEFRNRAFKIASNIFSPKNLSFYELTNIHSFYQIGKYVEALEIINEVEKKLSTSDKGLTAYGRIQHYINVEDIPNARKEYVRMMEYVEKFGSDHNVDILFKAKLLKLESKYTEAIENFKTYGQINKYVSRALIENHIAECYLRNNQLEQAEEILEKLLIAFPFDPATHYRLALIYKEAGRLNEARVSLEVANSIWSNSDKDYKLAQQAKNLYYELEVRI